MTHKHTPFEIFNGRSPTLFLSIIITAKAEGEQGPGDSTKLTTDEYVKVLRSLDEQQETKQVVVADHIKARAQEVIKQHTLKGCKNTIKKGDKVCVLLKPSKKKQTKQQQLKEPRWSEVVSILQVAHNNRYQVEVAGQKRYLSAQQLKVHKHVACRTKHSVIATKATQTVIVPATEGTTQE